LQCFFIAKGFLKEQKEFVIEKKLLKFPAIKLKTTTLLSSISALGACYIFMAGMAASSSSGLKCQALINGLVSWLCRLSHPLVIISIPSAGKFTLSSAKSISTPHAPRARQPSSSSSTPFCHSFYCSRL
jgi:hypothetical protein